MSTLNEPQLVAEGYREAQQVTRRSAKSFYAASYLLFGKRRRAAFALYAFCRRLDDMVDLSTSEPGDLSERLSRARQTVEQFYLPAPLQEASPQMLALQDCIHHFRVPQEPFQDLISGMEMDLTKHRYADFAELDLYCYRVAGVVGQMLTPVLGCDGPEAAEYAADLGRAMQLTNILRDVKEDLEKGRIYLPQDELAAYGISEEQLRAGRMSEGFRRFMRFQIERARSYYARASWGIPMLKGLGSQSMVRLMGALYGGILESIEQQDFDVFRQRAFVSGRRKLSLAARCLFFPSKPQASLGPGLGRDVTSK